MLLTHRKFNVSKFLLFVDLPSEKIRLRVVHLIFKHFLQNTQLDWLTEEREILEADLTPHFHQPSSC
jgi:hypothetical protein